MDFDELGLSEEVVHGVRAMHFMEPTAIQEKAIPLILEGRDVVGGSQTGTGKTAAFALPILTKLGGHGPLRCLVLEPTRELALQVEQAFLDYSRFGPLRTSVVYGGVGYGKQLEDLKTGIDILVATPGRLLDHAEQGNVKLSTVDFLVLDEADRMLDMGFLPDVRRIIAMCSKEGRQSLLFSATIPPEIDALAKWALKDPIEVDAGTRRTPAETISHAIYPVATAQKFDLLLELLKRTDFHSVLIFTRTKMEADRISGWLMNHEHTVTVMHSDRSQGERVEALEGFRTGKYEVMVATDIASRGIDVASITHVINYDVPQHPDDYVHRIGRTGRAKAEGDAFTLMTAEDADDVAAIERFIGKPIERRKLDNFKYTFSMVLQEGAGKQVSLRKIGGGRSRTGYSYGVKRR